MSLADLTTLFVVPPLNCLLAACLGAVFHRRRWGRVLVAMGLAGLFVLSMPLVSGTLLASLEVGLPLTSPTDDPPQAVVILSADESEYQLGNQTGFTVGHLTLERERAGARLARRTGLPILLTGGRIRQGSPTLAELMAESLHDDFGLAPLWLETTSKNTWQNAQNSAAILKAAGIDSVYVVTHAWHMRRALLAFRAAGLKVTAAPVEPLRYPGWAFHFWVPHVSSWNESYYALHEWIGYAWYALHG